MPVVEESVFIDRVPQEVFEYVTAAENLPVWDSSILEAEKVTPGPLALGTRWRGVSKILGRRFPWPTEVIELDPPHRSSNRTVDWSLSFTVTSTVRPEGDGSRYVYRVEAESGLGGVFGRLADPFVEKAHSRTVRANLDTLAELLSTGTASGS